MKTIIIGIAGGTGSGKTTLTEKLRDLVVCVFPHRFPLRYNLGP